MGEPRAVASTSDLHSKTKIGPAVGQSSMILKRKGGDNGGNTSVAKKWRALGIEDLNNGLKRESGFAKLEHQLLKAYTGKK